MWCAESIDLTISDTSAVEIKGGLDHWRGCSRGRETSYLSYALEKSRYQVRLLTQNVFARVFHHFDGLELAMVYLVCKTIRFPGMSQLLANTTAKSAINI